MSHACHVSASWQHWVRATGAAARAAKQQPVGEAQITASRRKVSGWCTRIRMGLVWSFRPSSISRKSRVGPGSAVGHRNGRRDGIPLSLTAWFSLAHAQMRGGECVVTSPGAPRAGPFRAPFQRHERPVVTACGRHRRAGDIACRTRARIAPAAYCRIAAQERTLAFPPSRALTTRSPAADSENVNRIGGMGSRMP